MGSEPEWAGPEQLRMMSQRSPASILYSNASCNINRMNSFCKNLKGFWDSKDVFKKHISRETLPWPKCLPKRGLGWFYIKKRLSTTSSKNSAVMHLCIVWHNIEVPWTTLYAYIYEVGLGPTETFPKTSYTHDVLQKWQKRHFYDIYSHITYDLTSLHVHSLLTNYTVALNQFNWFIKKQWLKVTLYEWVLESFTQSADSWNNVCNILHDNIT